MITDFNSVLDIIPLFFPFKSGLKVAVDATTGNGNDTLTLSNLVGQDGMVYSFDIQKDAIEKAQIKYTTEKRFENVQFINDSHVNCNSYVLGDIDIALFNLGFLPGGDKSITTNAADLIVALEQMRVKLSDGGIVILVVYPGHKSGLEELEALNTYVSRLDQKIYNGIKSVYINQKNNPPELFIIQKRPMRRKKGEL